MKALAEQVAHTSRLPDKLKTRIAESLPVGDIEVHPVKVLAKPRGRPGAIPQDAQPFQGVCVPAHLRKVPEIQRGQHERLRPYTYLDWSQKRLYGGFLEFGVLGQDKEGSSGDLAGKEQVFRLVTLTSYRKDVPKILNSQETLVWRVQVRRGFIQVGGTPSLPPPWLVWSSTPGACAKDES